MNMDKIKEFREFYGLSENDFPNKKIFEALKANNFDFAEAFESIII